MAFRLTGKSLLKRGEFAYARTSMKSWITENMCTMGSIQFWYARSGFYLFQLIYPFMAVESRRENQSDRTSQLRVFTKHCVLSPIGSVKNNSKASFCGVRPDQVKSRLLDLCSYAR